MSDIYLGSQAPIYQNVRIRVFDEKTGKVRIERTAKNRVTKLMLWGIARFLSGEFNDSTPDRIYEFCPRYIALGSNRISVTGETGGVSRNVTVNDTRLLNEYLEINLDGQKEAVKRISIQSRHHKQLNTNFTEPSVKLSLSAYISSSKFNGLEIGEAGLFSKEYDNNCLARVVFPPFRKKEGEVIDIQWEITLLSYGTTKYPERVSIESTVGKVVIPLKYTSYHLVTTPLKLYYADNIIFESFTDQNLFYVDLEQNQISAITPVKEMAESAFAKYLEEINYPTLDNLTPIETLYSQIVSYKLSNSQFYDNENNPAHLYLGNKSKIPNKYNLLADSDSNLLQDSDSNQLITSDPVVGTTVSQQVMMTYIYDEIIETADELTNARLFKLNENGDYDVQIKQENGEYGGSSYKVIDNLFYVRDKDNIENYTVLGRDSSNPNSGYYLYKGAIVHVDEYNNSNMTEYKYDYSDNTFLSIYKITATKSEDLNTGYYLAYSSKKELNDIFKIYYVKDGIVYYSNYWIDWSFDKETYRNIDEDTGYHISNDNYFVIGNYYKLNATISPSDATDKSLYWAISNSNISKINDSGVLESWNLGETLAFVNTTNGVKDRIIVEVVRDASYIPVEKITVIPEEVTFYVDSKEEQKTIIKALIEPVFATYKTVSFSFDTSAKKLLVVNDKGGPIVLSGNRAEIEMAKEGNIGRGVVTATAQGGISGNCYVNVVYTSSNTEDCDDLYHDLQQI